MAERLLGPYRLVEQRASGPAGDIWTAWDTRLNRRVIVTLIPRLGRDAEEGETLYAAFQDEMRRLSKVRHADVQAPIEYAGARSAEAWYVSEHSDGVPLRRVIDALGKIEWTQAAMLLHEVAVALGFVHSRGVLHAQLRPSAVLVQLRGRVVITNFGVALKVLLESGVAAVAGLGAVEGKLYLPPESLYAAPPSFRGDVYSLGVVAFEMLTGRLPFASEASVHAYVDGREAVPDPWRHVGTVPRALRDLVREMIAARPEGRPVSMAEVAARLKQILGDEGISDIRGTLREGLISQAEVVFGADPPEDAEPEATRIIKRDTVRGMGETSVAPRDTQPVHLPPEREAATEDSGGRRKRRTRRVRSAKAPGPKRRDTASFGQSGEPQVRSQTLERLAIEGGEPTRTDPVVRSMLLLLFGCGAAFAFWWLVLREAPPSPVGVSPEEVAAVEEGAPEDETYGVVTESAGLEQIPAGEPRSDDPVDIARDKADQLIESGNFPLAEAAARRALSMVRGGDARLTWLLGEALTGQGKFDEAVAAFVASDQAKSSRAIDGHVEAARLLTDQGRCGEALPLLEEAAQRASLNATALLQQGRCYAETGRDREAVAVLVRAVELAPQDLDLHLMLAQLAEKIGDQDLALAEYRALLAAEPGHKQARLGLTRLGAKLEPEAAVATARELLVEEGAAQDPDVLATAAEAAFRAGNFAEAARLFGDAVGASDAPTVTLLKNHAAALQRAGLKKSAIEAYQRVWDAGGATAADLHILGELLGAEGRIREARNALIAALRADPGRWRARFQLGVVELEDGEWARAAQAFRGVLKSRPDDLLTLNNLAKALLEDRQYADAAEVLRRVADLRRSDPAPLLTLASVLGRMQRSGEAAEVLAEACRRGAAEACQ